MEDICCAFVLCALCFVLIMWFFKFGRSLPADRTARIVLDYLLLCFRLQQDFGNIYQYISIYMCLDGENIRYFLD